MKGSKRLCAFPLNKKYDINKKSHYMAIGTNNLSKCEAINIFNNYPYNELLIDTAYRYGNELDISQALRESGYPIENVQFIGKICYEQQKRSVRSELQGTLNRLGIEKIDAYLIHSPRYVKFCDTWTELMELRNEGLIDKIGVSNFSCDQIEIIADACGEYPSINQIVCNPIDEYDYLITMINFCKAKGINLQVAGAFGGKRRSEELSEEQRNKIISLLVRLNCQIIIGTSKAEHMCQNMQVLEEMKCKFQINDY